MSRVRRERAEKALAEEARYARHLVFSVLDSVLRGDIAAAAGTERESRFALVRVEERRAELERLSRRK